MADALMELSLITTYLKNKDDAFKLMRALVESKLAACVNIFETHSCFEENNVLNEIKEWKVVAKTSPANANRVFEHMKSSHQCDTPYLVMQKAQANIEYVNWVNGKIK